MTMPPRQPTSTELLGPPTQLVDGSSFVDQYLEIFVNRIYRFTARRPEPLILDGGANVGLASLYWKQLYPTAQIVAFEPSPTVFEALTQNCNQWRLEKVRRVNAALWRSEGEQTFWDEGADSGRLEAPDEASDHVTMSVRTVRLRTYLEGAIDMLKLDIEGAESEVLLDCADRLEMVDHLCVEYHSFIGQPQPLDSMLAVLRSAGFRYYLQPQLLIPSPFVNHLQHKGMDQTVMIFAWREPGP